MAPPAAPTTRSALRLDPCAAETIRAAFRAAGGVEPCGYLLGRRTAWGAGVRHAVRGENLHSRSRGAFLLAPEEQLAVRRLARTRGLEVLGFWHGHPYGPPRPSAADLAGHGTSAPPWMLIAGREMRAGPVVLRAYEVRAGKAREIPLTSWA